MDARHARGRAAEQKACDYLLTRGLKLLARNVRSGRGEIDLVMQDTNSLVFVEVRYRQHADFGSATESVDTRKQQHLIRAAQAYLQKHDPAGRLKVRFDIVAMNSDIEDNIEWIRNAFGV